MLIAFELSMPGNNAWNGKWTGDGQCYAKVIDVGSSKKAQLKYERLCGKYSYGFGDGWRAAITVKVVDGKTARALRKASRGFCGYDWMIDSIRCHGDIYGPEKPHPTEIGTSVAP